jgi:hypothetical protein
MMPIMGDLQEIVNEWRWKVGYKRANQALEEFRMFGPPLEQFNYKAKYFVGGRNDSKRAEDGWDTRLKEEGEQDLMHGSFRGHTLLSYWYVRGWLDKFSEQVENGWQHEGMKGWRDSINEEIVKDHITLAFVSDWEDILVALGNKLKFS